MAQADGREDPKMITLGVGERTKTEKPPGGREPPRGREAVLGGRSPLGAMQGRRSFVLRASSGARWPHTQDCSHSSRGQMFPALSGSMATSAPAWALPLCSIRVLSPQTFLSQAPAVSEGDWTSWLLAHLGSTSFLEAQAGLIFPWSPGPSTAAGPCMVGALLVLRLTQSST